MMRPNIGAWIATLSVLGSGLLLLPATAQGQQELRNIERDSDPKQSLTWAILIGIEKYDSIRPAHYAHNDARNLKTTLEERGLFGSTKATLLVNPDAPIAGQPAALKPDRATILAEVPKVLAQAREHDRVILFFSGHGHLADDGTTYLAPRDIDPANVAQTAIPLAEVRDMLLNCRAQTKLLILDACHSGNAKAAGGAAQGITSKDIEVVFKKATGIHTLASCQADEESFSDDRTQQGLYSYWLNIGLQGAADRDRDFKITPTELHEFVDQPVVLESQRLGQRQTPGQIVGPEVRPAAVIELQPDSWTEALPRMAELLHVQLARQKPGAVAIVEFPRRDGQQDKLGQLGVFGGFAADKIHEKLQNLLQRENPSPYTLVARRFAEQALKGAAPEQLLGDPAVRNRMAQNARVDVVVSGSFQPYPLSAPSGFQLNCEAIQLQTGQNLATASTIVRADASLLSAMGVSWSSPLADEPGAGSTVGALATYVHPSPDFPLDDLPPHPLLRDDFPLGVEIRSGDRKLVPQSESKDRNKQFVRVRPKQEFDIWIRNGLQRDLLVHVYIDGLNVVDKNPITADTQGYLLYKAGSQQPVKGWRHLEVVNDQINEQIAPFVFTEAARSVAAARGFGEKVGQITVEFCEARPMGWLDKLGVGESDRRLFRTYPRAKYCEGRLLHSVTIHYVRE